MIFIILIFVFGLFHPEINTNYNYPFSNLPNSQSIIASTITTIIMIIIFFIITLASYLIPIKVDIDKTTKKITYQYLTYNPIRTVGESTFKNIKTIPIENLQKLVYTNNIPEIPLLPLGSVPYAMAKYCFVLRDDTSNNVYAGFFSIFSHREAFMKIAGYLRIPYENDFGEENTLGKLGDFPVNKTHLIKILLMILLGLILILVLFIGSIFLLGFLTHFQ